jgi:hypothetical protein
MATRLHDHQQAGRHLNKNNTLGGGFDEGCDATTFHTTTIIFFVLT